MVNINRDDEEKKQTGLTLYAAEHWLDHVEHVAGANLVKHCNKQTRLELSSFLFRFVNDEDVLLRWSQKIAWSAFTLENATLVARLASALVDQDSAQAYSEWVTSCHDRPQNILLPIAKVFLHQILHQTCLPLPLLRIVASIKALVDGSQNADELPSKLPLETLLSSTKWLGPIESAEWN